MSLNAIQSIKEAEAKAEDMRKDAMQKARDLIRQAEQEGQASFEEIVRAAQAEGETLLNRTSHEAEREIAALTIQNDANRKLIQDKAQEKLPEAVAFIMGRIVKSQ